MALATFVVVSGPQFLLSEDVVVRITGGDRVAECVLQGLWMYWHAQYILNNTISGLNAMKKIKLDEVEKSVSRRPHKGVTFELSGKGPAVGMSRGRTFREGGVSAKVLRCILCSRNVEE